MKHLALYRKWRPQRFSDLVGQKHISRTLLNAIRLDRLAHAYLFCGPRGTGKTSSARLLAKALNCEAPVNYEPCNACQNCEEITAGHSLDVIEIDAASNRGIDSARDLREQVRFSASAGKYRIFIIDEFHMLTKEAFNALLKTLEEPPDKIVFVLATTEPQAILPTIVSRCQRFDFQRIGVTDMKAYLREIATAEHIGISDAALDALSRKANGGVRDGMSLLDQVQAIGEPGEDLPDNLVYLTLGLVEENELIALLQAAFQHEPETLIKNTRLLLEQGHDALQLVQELIQLLRHLSLAHLPPETLENLSVPSHLIAPLKVLAQSVSRGDQVNALELLLRTGDRLHHCSQPDIWLEADLLCLCLQNESALLKRVEHLEKQIKQGVPHQRVASPAPTTAHAPTPAPVPENRKTEIITPPPSETKPTTTASIAPPEKPPVSMENSNDPQVLWNAFVEAVKTHQKPVIGFLMNGHLQQVDTANKTWVLAFQGRFQRDRIQQKLSDRSLQKLASQIMGETFEIELTLAGEKKKAEPIAASPVVASVIAPVPLIGKPTPQVVLSPEEPFFEEPDFEEDAGMADMGYLPSEPEEKEPDFSLIEALPRPEAAAVEPLAKTPTPTAPERAVSSNTAKPHGTQSETSPSDSKSLLIESLQEVADIFKGKIVRERNKS